MSIVKATFTNGVFKPVEPLSLAEGTTVEIEVPASSTEKPWMEHCGWLSSEEADKMLADIEAGFAQVAPDDWL